MRNIFLHRIYNVRTKVVTSTNKPKCQIPLQLRVKHPKYATSNVQKSWASVTLTVSPTYYSEHPMSQKLRVRCVSMSVDVWVCAFMCPFLWEWCLWLCLTVSVCVCGGGGGGCKWVWVSEYVRLCIVWVWVGWWVGRWVWDCGHFGQGVGVWVWNMLTRRLICLPPKKPLPAYQISRGHRP